MLSSWQWTKQHVFSSVILIHPIAKQVKLPAKSTALFFTFRCFHCASTIAVCPLPGKSMQELAYCFVLSHWKMLHLIEKNYRQDLIFYIYFFLLLMVTNKVFTFPPPVPVMNEAEFFTISSPPPPQHTHTTQPIFLWSYSFRHADKFQFDLVYVILAFGCCSQADTIIYVRGMFFKNIFYFKHQLCDVHFIVVFLETR